MFVQKRNMDFTNTEKAFITKSNRDLKWAHRLFSIMANPVIQKIGQVGAQLSMRLKLPIEGIVKKTLFVQFVGGETIDKCLPVVKELAKHNVKSILDYSVEGKENEADINAALDETLRSVKNAGQNPNIPFAVFKPTAMVQSAVLEKASTDAELNEEEKELLDKFKARIEKLAKTAFENNIPLLIDAEDSWYQEILDQIADKMMAKYNKEKAIIFNTWQMYRHDRLEHLKKTYQKAKDNNYYLGAKFVRGAYMEKERERAAEKGYESPIHPNKEATDQAYNAALRFSVDHIDRMAIFNGTHNEESNRLLTELMDEKGLKRDDNRIWFSQLFGMSDHISFNLAAEGYNVAKYLPYGPVKHVLPYLLRRAEENTSVGGQSSRELRLIKQEMKRRKLKKQNG
jgi:proline dehydrogenase